jgi:hypothetical protein
MLAFTAGLKWNSTWQSLDISRDAEDSRHLVAAIQFVPLKELYVTLSLIAGFASSGKVCPQCWKAAGEGWSENTTLQDVKVTCNVIDEAFPHFHSWLFLFAHRNKVLLPFTSGSKCESLEHP